jgi:hypothetical protein
MPPHETRAGFDERSSWKGGGPSASAGVKARSLCGGGRRARPGQSGACHWKRSRVGAAAPLGRTKPPRTARGASGPLDESPPLPVLEAGIENAARLAARVGDVADVARMIEALEAERGDLVARIASRRAAVPLDDAAIVQMAERWSADARTPQRHPAAAQPRAPRSPFGAQEARRSGGLESRSGQAARGAALLKRKPGRTPELHPTPSRRGEARPRALDDQGPLVLREGPRGSGRPRML